MCFGREQKAHTRGFLKFETGFHDSAAPLNRLCCGLPGTVGRPVGGRDCRPFGAGCCGGWRSDISSAVPSTPSPTVFLPGSLSIIPVRDCIIELEVLVMRPDNPLSNLTEGRSLIICCVLQINPCNSWLAMGLRLRMSGAREEKILISSLNSTFYSSFCRLVQGQYKAGLSHFGGYSLCCRVFPGLGQLVVRYLCQAKLF